MKWPRDAKPEDIEKYDKPRSTLKFLEKACDGRVFFTIYGQDNRAWGKTRVLTINHDDKSLLLDRVMDSLAEERILGDAGPTLYSEVEGQRMWFEVKRLKPQREGDETYYLADFPRTIYRHQRRQAYRVPLPQSVEGQATVSPDKNQSLSAKVTDISVGGICLHFAGDLSRSFSTGLSLPASAIGIGSELHMTADLEVRIVRYLEDEDITRLGARFINLDTSNERNLARVLFRLQALQREMAKEEA